MSADSIERIASWILRMNHSELQRLRTLLMDGGDPAGVTAVLPKDPGPNEGSQEVPFAEWPSDYWESQA